MRCGCVSFVHRRNTAWRFTGQLDGGYLTNHSILHMASLAPAAASSLVGTAQFPGVSGGPIVASAHQVTG